MIRALITIALCASCIACGRAEKPSEALQEKRQKFYLDCLGPSERYSTIMDKCKTAAEEMVK
jgi:hypothetical protein